MPRNQLQPGDLIFFYSPIHLVGNGSAGVTYEDMNHGWWSNHYASEPRVL
ncbi:hypothetical protein [Paenibacillus macquariensis]|nr:hypothetical protein [Paenibacillus macquariensis]MEC0091934.1 hypothetical protein [Paenibacillus macquariensis]